MPRPPPREHPAPPLLTYSRKVPSVTKRRIEITVETERLLLTRGRRVSLTAWCAGCGRRVLMIMPEEAARLTRLSARAVYRLVEEGRLHFTETADETLLICSDSLPPPKADGS